MSAQLCFLRIPSFLLRLSTLPTPHYIVLIPNICPTQTKCSAAQAHYQRILFIPDHLSSSNPNTTPIIPPSWYYKLPQQLPQYHFVLLDNFPNPYASNTKRWERVWLDYLRSVLRVTDWVIGHGTGADALLRLLEANKVAGAFIVVPGCDEYHAAERHGRRYLWENIKENVGFVNLIVAEGVLEKEEMRCIESGLQIKNAIVLKKDRGRMCGDETFPELVQLVKNRFGEV